MELILIDKNQKEYRLREHSVTLGRSKLNSIVIDDPYISRKHCQITRIKDKFYLEDLKTKNGTFVNSKKVEDHLELSNGDRITLYKKGPEFSVRIIKLPAEEDLITHVKIQKQIEKSVLKKVLIAASSGFIIIVVFLMAMFFYFNSAEKNKLAGKGVEKDLANLMYNKYHEENFKTDMVMIHKIEKYMDYYEKSGTFKIGLARREKYIDIIENIFRKRNIPVDLSYIAFVESNYDPYAYNPVSGARGMWQFMPDTAREYGLKVNRKVDERTDPVKSTEAAAKYISDLIAVFGVSSFTLSLAAYNVGDGSLRMSLQSLEDPVNDRNFWYLYQHNLIPDETKEFVLKILALMILNEKYAGLENKKK